MKTEFRLTYFFSILLSGLFFPLPTISQVTFQKTFGGSHTDYAYSIDKTENEGYFLTGYTESFGEGSRDVYLIRTNSRGETLWSKTYGGQNTDYAWTIASTTDGGVIIGSHSESAGAGGHDVQLIKVDAQGALQWSMVYGGTSADGAYSLKQTYDGGFVVAAHTSSYGEGQHEIYLIRTDTSGNVLWTKTYGSSGGDFLRALDFTPDLGFIMVAETYSFGAEGADIYVVRTDMQGDTLWTRTFGGPGDDFGYSIRLTNDQNYIIAGHTRSFGQGQLDALLMKIDDHGEVIWAKTFGGPDEDFAYSVAPTPDGGYILAGGTKSFAMGGFCDILCNDIYLIRTDEKGDTLWTRAYGSLGEERGWQVQPAPDGGYAVLGISTGFGAGAEDFYFIKTDENGNTGCAEKGTQTIIGDPVFQLNTTTTVVNSGLISEEALMITGSPETSENTFCQTTNTDAITTVEIFEIFPNPAKNRLFVLFQLAQPEILEFQLYDFSGRLLIDNASKYYMAGKNEISMDVKNMPNGFYLLVASSKNAKHFRKLVVLGN